VPARGPKSLPCNDLCAPLIGGTLTALIRVQNSASQCAAQNLCYSLVYGAGDGDRTRDTQLGKRAAGLAGRIGVMLYGHAA